MNAFLKDAISTVEVDCDGALRSVISAVEFLRKDPGGQADETAELVTCLCCIWPQNQKASTQRELGNALTEIFNRFEDLAEVSTQTIVAICVSIGDLFLKFEQFLPASHYFNYSLHLCMNNPSNQDLSTFDVLDSIVQKILLVEASFLHNYFDFLRQQLSKVEIFIDIILTLERMGDIFYAAGDEGNRSDMYYIFVMDSLASLAEPDLAPACLDAVSDISQRIQSKNSVVPSLIALLLSPSSYRQKLNSLRESVSVGEDLQCRLSVFNAGIFALVQEIVRDAVRDIGHSSAQYSIILVGSLARSEACPYSDLECAVVLADDASKSDLQYFELLFQLIELRLVSLGEDDRFIWKMKRGLRLDLRFSPNGSSHLMYTITGLLTQLPKMEQIERNSFTEIKYLYGDESVYRQLSGRLSALLNSNGFRKVLAREFLLDHIEALSAHHGSTTEAHQISSKESVLRYPQLILHALCLYFEIPQSNSFDRVYALIDCGHLRRELGVLLVFVLRLGFRWRFGAQMHFRSENDTINSAQEVRSSTLFSPPVHEWAAWKCIDASLRDLLRRLAQRFTQESDESAFYRFEEHESMILADVFVSVANCFHCAIGSDSSCVQYENYFLEQALQCSIVGAEASLGHLMQQRFLSGDLVGGILVDDSSCIEAGRSFASSVLSTMLFPFTVKPLVMRRQQTGHTMLLPLNLHGSQQYGYPPNRCEAIIEIEKFNYSMHFIRTLLLLPPNDQDFISFDSFNLFGESVAKVQANESSVSFDSPITGNLFLSVRDENGLNFIFRNAMMDQSIDMQAVHKVMSLDPEAAVEQWLSFIAFQEEENSPSLRPMISGGILPAAAGVQIYRRLRHLQKIMSSRAHGLTHRGVLVMQEPDLARFFSQDEGDDASFLNLMSRRVMVRPLPAFGSCATPSSDPPPVLGSASGALKYFRSLVPCDWTRTVNIVRLDLLKGQNNSFLSLPNNCLREEVLFGFYAGGKWRGDGLEFSSIDANTQGFIFSTLLKPARINGASYGNQQYRRLSFRGSAVITEALVKKLVALSTDLVELDLTHCKSLGFSFLKSLETELNATRDQVVTMHTSLTLELDLSKVAAQIQESLEISQHEPHEDGQRSILKRMLAFSSLSSGSNHRDESESLVGCLISSSDGSWQRRGFELALSLLTSRPVSKAFITFIWNHGAANMLVDNSKAINLLLVAISLGKAKERMEEDIPYIIELSLQCKGAGIRSLAANTLVLLLQHEKHRIPSTVLALQNIAKRYLSLGHGDEIIKGQLSGAVDVSGSEQMSNCMSESFAVAFSSDGQAADVMTAARLSSGASEISATRIEDEALIQPFEAHTSAAFNTEDVLELIDKRYHFRYITCLECIHSTLKSSSMETVDVIIDVLCRSWEDPSHLCSVDELVKSASLDVISACFTAGVTLSEDRVVCLAALLEHFTHDLSTRIRVEAFYIIRTLLFPLVAEDVSCIERAEVDRKVADICSHMLGDTALEMYCLQQAINWLLLNDLDSATRSRLAAVFTNLTTNNEVMVEEGMRCLCQLPGQVVGPMMLVDWIADRIISDRCGRLFDSDLDLCILLLRVCPLLSVERVAVVLDTLITLCSSSGTVNLISSISSINAKYCISKLIDHGLVPSHRRPDALSVIDEL